MELAELYGMDFIEVSAKDSTEGNNVEEMFHKAAKNMYLVRNMI